MVSRKVNFLRSISLAVFVFWLFLADKDSSRSYVNLQHCLWRSFAYFTSTLLFFGIVGLYRFDMQCLFSAWFCPWFRPSTFFFARHQHGTLSSLPPKTRDVAARDSGEKRVQSTEPDIVSERVNFGINLRSHLCAGVILRREYT